MIAKRIIGVKDDSPEWIKQLEGRILIFMGKHRIILPNEKYKRIYLSKKRIRLLEEHMTRWYRYAFEDTWYYHNHTPKSIKAYADAHREPVYEKEVQRLVNHKIVTVKKPWWKKLFN